MPRHSSLAVLVAAAPLWIALNVYAQIPAPEKGSKQFSCSIAHPSAPQKAKWCGTHLGNNNYQIIYTVSPGQAVHVHLKDSILEGTRRKPSKPVICATFTLHQLNPPENRILGTQKVCPTKKETLWKNSAVAGMPATQVYFIVNFDTSFIKDITSEDNLPVWTFEGEYIFE